MGENCRHLDNLADWIHASIKKTWLTEEAVPSPPLHGTSMEELGMKHAIYTQHFGGPNEELHSSCMNVHISRSAPGAGYGTLASALVPGVKCPIAIVAAIMADLHETEREIDGKTGKNKGSS